MTVAQTSIDAYQNRNRTRCELVCTRIKAYIQVRKTAPTRSEVSRAINEPINVVTARVNEMLNTSIAVIGRRKCAVTGSQAQTLGLINE